MATKTPIPGSDEELAQLYVEAGVAPETSPIVDVEKLLSQVPKHVHKWVAQGNFLHCEVGHYAHGIPYNHVNQVFVGTDSQGHPQFKQLDVTI